MQLANAARQTAWTPWSGLFPGVTGRTERPADSRPNVADSAQIWRLLATDAQENHDAERALRSWREVARRDADPTDAMFHIACCHALLQEPGRACVIFDALAHAPGTPGPLRERCLRLLGMLEPAAAH